MFLNNVLAKLARLFVVFQHRNSNHSPPRTNRRNTDSWLTTWWMAKLEPRSVTSGWWTPCRSTEWASTLCIRCVQHQGCWFCYYPIDYRWRKGWASSSPPSLSQTGLCYCSAPLPRWSVAWPTFFQGCSLFDEVHPHCWCSPILSFFREGSSGPSDGSLADDSSGPGSGSSLGSEDFPQPGSPIFEDRSDRCHRSLVSSNTLHRWIHRRWSPPSRCHSRCTNLNHRPRLSPRSRRYQSPTRCCSRCCCSNGWKSFPGFRSGSFRRMLPRFGTPIRLEGSRGRRWFPGTRILRSSLLPVLNRSIWRYLFGNWHGHSMIRLEILLRENGLLCAIDTRLIWLFVFFFLKYSKVWN